MHTYVCKMIAAAQSLNVTKSKQTKKLKEYQEFSQQCITCNKDDPLLDTKRTYKDDNPIRMAGKKSLRQSAGQTKQEGFHLKAA